MEFTGNAHLSEPRGGFGMEIARVPVLHPANHNAPSIRSKERLGGVKVNAVINGMVRLCRKGFGLCIVIAQKIECAVAVVVFQPFGKHIL